MPTESLPPSLSAPPAPPTPTEAPAPSEPAAPGTPAPPADPERHQQRVRAARAVHWARAARLIRMLLALWLATGFGTVFFARNLAHLSVFGWPLSFYLAAQGASLIYLAIIGAYAWRMRILDRDFARLLEDGA